MLPNGLALDLAAQRGLVDPIFWAASLIEISSKDIASGIVASDLPPATGEFLGPGYRFCFRLGEDRLPQVVVHVGLRTVVARSRDPYVRKCKTARIAMAEDPELKAIKTIIELMQPLDETGRSRVIEYVLKRLGMTAFQSEAAIIEGEPIEVALPTSARPRMVDDIRTLTAKKQPRSANEMVALIAYYLSEVAEGNDASNSVNVETVRKYFKMAGFPMPRVLKNALTNAAAAGYLENISRGEYRLNPVGYNLVVHGLPRSSAANPTTSNRRKRR